MNGERRLKIRFFMSLALISICSVLILASALFVWFRDKTIDNVNKANESVLLNTETVFGKYLETVQNYTMAFYRQPNINTVMQSGDSSWSDQLFSALSQIKGTLTVNPYLENAYIMGQDEPALMFENNPLSEEAKRELFERIKNSRIKDSPYVWNAELNNGERQTVIITYYNDRVYDDSEYTGAIAILTNLRKLQGNIFTDRGDGNTRYAVLSADGVVLMQSGSPGDGFDKALLERIVSGESSSGSMVWKAGQDRKQLITYHLAAKQGLWFLSETPYEDSIRDISNALVFIIVLCIALAVLASAIAAILSHRMYKPIGTLFGHIRSLSGERYSAASGGGGFEEAGRELERIAGRFGELKRENEDSALLAWLTSPYRSGSGTPSALPLMKGSPGNTAFCVAVLQLDVCSETGSEAMPDDDDPMERIRAIPRMVERLFEGTSTCRGFFPIKELPC